jgi:hypothetical protein
MKKLNLLLILRKYYPWKSINISHNQFGPNMRENPWITIPLGRGEVPFHFSPEAKQEMTIV